MSSSAELPPPDSPRKSARWPLLVAPLAVLVFLLFLMSEHRTPYFGGLAIGEPAPPLRAAGWINGPAPTVDELKGKVVLIDAWATWCGPCRRAMPEMVALHKRFAPRGVEFFGLTSEPAEDLPQIAEYLTEAGVPWRNGYGAVETLIPLQAEVIPLRWVIGKDGRVFWNESSSDTIETALEAALREPLQQ